MGQVLKLDGETMIFPVVAHPVGQVKSPGALSQIMAERGFNGLVVPFHVQPEGLPAWLEGVKVMRNCGGIVVTVPHKIACLDFCSRVSDRARASGAVNIAIRDGDDWIGDATDGHGYMDGIAAEGFDVGGTPALLIGAGGAGAAIAYEILARGASELAVHDIDIARRDSLIARLEQRFPGKLRIGGTDPRGFALIAHATPLGMKESDPLPVDVSRLGADQFVADVVTRPAVSPLIAAARATGCRTMPGSGMFEAQAFLLAELLMGVRRIAS
ncbi:MULTISPECIES: shikimate dehydrogenase family protein [unclassified Haematobacter]|uniref:shikimate dehydrogenase family protein n=1 Tax=unclassified Haematobacter TaxID=2640585 RepID=UPI0025C19262|nr:MULTISPECIES: shikimate dehydrogenase [unclassified Haematobacter]